jgi:hypothetical protein
MERKEFTLTSLNCEINDNINITNDMAFGTNDGNLQNDDTAEEDDPCNELDLEKCIPDSTSMG